MLPAGPRLVFRPLQQSSAHACSNSLSHHSGNRTAYSGRCLSCRMMVQPQQVLMRMLQKTIPAVLGQTTLLQVPPVS
jgi:hypothetical protein